MKTIIAGSRKGISYQDVLAAIAESDFGITEVVSGGAEGADRHGEEWAELEGLPVKRFNAKWRKHGRAAGPIRNREMAEYADALIAIWDGSSRGTANMVAQAGERGLRIYVYTIEKHQRIKRKPLPAGTIKRVVEDRG